MSGNGRNIRLNLGDPMCAGGRPVSEMEWTLGRGVSQILISNDDRDKRGVQRTPLAIRISGGVTDPALKGVCRHGGLAVRKGK